MVWNSSGSTLYKAVERHNSAEAVPQQHEAAPQQRCHSEKTHKNMPASPLSQLMQDGDTLLLLAILLVLLHEKADTKLIIALAFVIFC